MAVKIAQATGYGDNKTTGIIVIDGRLRDAILCDEAARQRAALVAKVVAMNKALDES